MTEHDAGTDEQEQAAGTEEQEQAASYEEELAGYLQERIKPGLNSGAIPLLARSIAKDIAHRQGRNGSSGNAEPADESGGGGGDDVPDFEDEMRDLQADLGDDWVLRFSVKGDDAWLTAEKEDGSQHVEAPNAEVLFEAVQLLNEGGGRS